MSNEISHKGDEHVPHSNLVTSYEVLTVITANENRNRKKERQLKQQKCILKSTAKVHPQKYS